MTIEQNYSKDIIEENKSKYLELILTSYSRVSYQKNVEKTMRTGLTRCCTYFLIFGAVLLKPGDAGRGTNRFSLTSITRMNCLDYRGVVMISYNAENPK